MIRLFLAALCFAVSFLSTGSAQAQSIALRAGEHGDFTRLVLQIDGLDDWTLGRTEQGYGLSWAVSADAANLQPDISGTFSKIARNRLADVSIEPQQDQSFAVFFDLACACHARPSVYRNTYLVIDIHDGPAPAGSPFERAFARDDNRPPSELPDTGLQSYDWLTAQADLAPAPRPTADPAQAQPAPIQPDAVAQVPPKTETATAPEVSGEPPRTAELPDPLETARQLSSFRRSLIESLASAASTGRVALTPEPAQTAAETAALPAGEPALAGLSFGDAGALSDQGATCPEKALFDLSSWSAELGENAYLRLTETRSNLLGEFDDPLPEAVQESVKAHLALGFGHEARQLLSNFGQVGAEADILLALSYVIDQEEPPENPFEGFHSCPSNAALWSLLAAPEDQPLANLDADAVAMAFLELPPYLRVHLAQPATDRLLVNGAEAAARMIRDATVRAGPEAGAVSPVLDAKLELASGDAAAAETAITQAPPSDAERMALLVEARFRQNVALSAEDMIALESFLFAEGRDANGSALSRAYALAQALDGRADEALASPHVDAATRADLWSYLSNQGGPAALITATGNARPDDIATVAPDTRTAIARRLLDLGLPDMAQAWLPDPDAQPDLMAQIHLAERDGLAALDAISKSAAPPETRAALQADAYRGLGDYPAASALLLSLGNAAEAERMQRWARTWDPATSQVDDLWRQIGLDTARVTATDAPASLGLGKDLINRSLSTRERVQALLAETDLANSAEEIPAGEPTASPESALPADAEQPNP